MHVQNSDDIMSDYRGYFDFIDVNSLSPLKNVQPQLNASWGWVNAEGNFFFFCFEWIT